MSSDIICFDCDSTLSEIEGIDVLAERAGCGAEMAALTNAAMNGEVPLESVYAQRLSLIKPDRQAIKWVADLYIEEIVQGVEQVFQQLHDEGRQVHIISGGLKQAILPLAEKLNVVPENVHAVEVLFASNGDYLDFNQQSPLARNGGKADICTQLNPANLKMAIVGDGNTDMEAKKAGAFCIGFGGVVAREIVRKQADVFVEDSDLQAVLAYLL
ncbi:phosphoserine phosphatase [Bathymodiolus japonicus methanotrophic gill symbiont]|uniref:HAD-IB family phosphatase n=1 Tax=Bathymodiolus japonicus methanotrophic gill symbiont TaxID=113269 RepID=UPI001B78C78C|nr:HAD-IB family phosphatase [Bathymodiolus japonicus methanotrophic gill symbiont]GFO71973.1 phosphoserine phosphatase [Bathymodiolus japonicus methanotrophic gill symbiont]